MKHHITTVAVLLALALYASATVPNGYYKTLDGKAAQELKDAIHSLTAKHTKLSYSSLWYYYPETDPREDDPNKVWDMYSNTTYYFSSRRGDDVSGMNKEHSFPKSWWGGTKSADAYSDLHHLIPVEQTANSARSNYPFGEVASANWDNGLSRRGTPRAGQGGGSPVVFEPADQYKGDFARIYFYMVSCYQDYNWKNTYMLSNSAWQTLTPWAIDMLLDWARQDPVSQKEINRNEAIFRFQNNRNPFVDDPELMEYIWGNKVGYAYNDTTYHKPDPELPDSTQLPQLLTPTQGTILDFGDVPLGKSATLTLYVRGLNLTKDLNMRLYRYQYRMFSLDTTTITAEQANDDNGIPIQVTYTPTTLGQHQAKILFSEGGMTSTIGVDLQARCVEPTLNGDINGDGKIDISDLNIVVNILLGNEPEDIDFDPDINNDGTVDISDLNQLINLILSN